jgi:uncharacterized protein (TIGR02266 family)
MTSFREVAFPYEETPTLLRRRPARLEKRSAARLPIEMDVNVEGAAHRFQATTADVSGGGMFVITQRAIPVGVEVMLGFTLPNGTSLEVLGVVQWQTNGDGKLRPAGLGIAFFCLEPEAKGTLERFCSAREPLYFAGAHEAHEAHEANDERSAGDNPRSGEYRRIRRD